MAQNPYIIAPSLGLVQGAAQANRMRGLASGFEKIRSGDESGWAEAFNADPKATMDAWNTQQELAQKTSGKDWTSDTGRMWGIAHDTNASKEDRDLANQWLKYSSRDPNVIYTNSVVGEKGKVRGKYEGEQEVKGQKGWTTVNGQDKVLKGSEAEREWLASNSKTIKSNGTAIRAGKTVLADIADLKRLYKEDPSSISGFSASMVNFIPGTVAATAKAKADSIKGNIAVDNLLNIKQSGAGLGQVPQSQADMLSGLFGSLAQTQDDKEFMRTLDRIEKVYSEVISGAEKEVKGIYDKVYDPDIKEEQPTQDEIMAELKRRGII